MTANEIFQLMEIKDKMQIVSVEMIQKQIQIYDSLYQDRNRVCEDMPDRYRYQIEIFALCTVV